MSYHNAFVPFDRVVDNNPGGTISLDSIAGKPEKTDQRWPRLCECGYQFTEKDEYQLFAERLYYRQDNKELFTLRDSPPGAMWYGDWMLTEGSNRFRGPDGHCLMVRLPNGNEWHIDSQASNCTMPGDDEHKCWVRHGDPPNITVDKNGHTCAAGGGSIQSGDYHGFLRNGEFVQ